MNLSILGTGYVGLVSGVCFADLGHRVVCIDHDTAKIASLKSGKSPLYEPGLQEMISRNIAAGRLLFSTDVAEGVRGAEAVFIAVGTPASEMDGQPDLSHLNAAVAALSRAVEKNTVLVVKSTVPVGTVRRIAEQVARFRPADGLEVASNPEFLRQGAAVEDFMKPDRIVVGVSAARAHDVLAQIYQPLLDTGVPLVTTTYESAEMIKYASNTMLAARIAFINEMADLCERVGANIREVARGVGLDHRIGEAFLQAGPGFGGSCFPKDAQALKGMADAAGVPAALVDAIIDSNLRRRDRMVEKIIRAVGGMAEGKTIAVLGLTFKPGTDDMRESVSLLIVPALAAAGAKLRLYDPEGMREARKHFTGDSLAWCADAYEALTGADCAVLLTEWNEFKSLDLAQVKRAMREPLMVDLRNVYRRRAMAEAGFRYISIGRAEVKPGQAEVKDMAPKVEQA